jgi:predicted dehydrogenase
MPKKRNIGVVGCGARAQIVHLPFLKKSSKCTLSAICDSDPRKIDYLGSKYSVAKRYLDFQEMVEDPDINAIVVATPNYLHAPMTITALKYGKDVLCEIPMSINLREAREVLRVAKRTKRQLMLAMNNRLRPDVQVLKKFIRQGELGDIYYLKTGWLIGTREWVLSPGRMESISRGGGAFLSLGIQLLDIALFLLANKKPKTVFGSVHKKEAKVDVEDTAMCTVNFTDGTLLTIEVNWSLLFEKDFLYCNVFGNRGAALLNPLKVQKELHNELFNVTPKLAHENTYKISYELQVQTFCECLSKKKSQPPISYEDGLTMAKISEAFHTSAKKKHSVRI